MYGKKKNQVPSNEMLAENGKVTGTGTHCTPHPSMLSVYLLQLPQVFIWPVCSNLNLFQPMKKNKKNICLIPWKLYRCKKGIIACILRQFLTCYFLLFEYSKFFTIMIEENVVLLFVKFLKLMIKITINKILETNHFSGSSSCKSSLTLQFVGCCMTSSIRVLFQLTKNYITNL